MFSSSFLLIKLLERKFLWRNISPPFAICNKRWTFRLVRKYESHLSWMALSRLECSSALAQCLSELQQHVASTSSESASWKSIVFSTSHVPVFIQILNERYLFLCIKILHFPMRKISCYAKMRWPWILCLCLKAICSFFFGTLHLALFFC